MNDGPRRSALDKDVKHKNNNIINSTKLTRLDYVRDANWYRPPNL